MIIPFGIFLIFFVWLVCNLWRKASYTETLQVTIKRRKNSAKIVATLKYDIIKLEAVTVRDNQYQCVLYTDEIERKYRSDMNLYRQMCEYLHNTQPDICIIEIVR